MNNLIAVFRALGEETRIKIISMLSKKEMCVDELIKKLGISQSAVSHHVKILKHAGLLNFRREGKWTFYSINQSGFARLEKGVKEWIKKQLKQLELEPLDSEEQSLQN